MNLDPSENNDIFRVLNCRFKRVSDRRFIFLASKGYFVYQCWPELYGSELLDKDKINLVQYYAALSLNFGESGFNYDNWKGAFSFGFEIDVYKGEKSFKYALNVKNWRGTVEFKYYKVLSKEQLEANSRFLNKPIEDEFSAYEMKILDNFFYGLFLSTRNLFNLNEIPDFLKTNESNLIIFGCIDGKFFEHYFETHQEYDEEETRLMKIIKSRESIDEWASISKDWITVSVPYTVIAEQD